MLSLPIRYTDAAGSSLIHVAAQLGHAHTILLLSLVAPDLPQSQNANGEVRWVLGLQVVVTEACKACRPSGCTSWATPAAGWAWTVDCFSACCPLRTHSPPTLLPWRSQVPLTVAARCGHTNAIAALLLVAPSSAASLSRRGTTPLHSVCAGGHLAATRLLLQARPEAAAVPSMHGWLPLHGAAAVGSAAIAALLLEAAPQAAAAVCNGRTPFEVALEHLHRHGSALKHEAVARCLLPATPTDSVLPALAAAGPAVQHLFADCVAAAPALSKEQWALVPVPCAGLCRALPATLARGVAQAQQLVAHLPPDDAARLRTFALCLARLQRQLELELPPALIGRLLSLTCIA